MSATRERPLSEAFTRVCDLALALGVKSIKDLPGCWEYQVDEHWWIAVNGHNGATRCAKGADVPPFRCYVEFNGWPAGIIDPYGGTIVAGEAANEDAFIAALDKAIEAVG